MSILGRRRQRMQQQVKKQTISRRTPNDFLRVIDAKMTSPFIVGEKVWDTLTRKLHTVIGISYEHGHCGNKLENCYHCWGVWIDSDWCDGARHPWELTKTEDIRG